MNNGCNIPYNLNVENEKPALFLHMGLELRKKLVKCYTWNTALYVAETWTLRAVDQKNVENFEM
jgi:hypothetical protein